LGGPASRHGSCPKVDSASGFLQGLGFGGQGLGFRVGEVSRGENIAVRGIEPESYITEYTSVYEDQSLEFEVWGLGFAVGGLPLRPCAAVRCIDRRLRVED